jgi:hypothetical protein
VPLEFRESMGNIVIVRATGRLTKQDHAQFAERMELVIERWGRLRMMFVMEDFDGWDPASAWEELKFELKHRRNLKRVAVVGEKTWERWAARFSELFTGTDVKFYDSSQADEAHAWIESGW